MLKPSLIFDLILLAVLLVSAMASYRKGLLTAIVQLPGGCSVWRAPGLSAGRDPFIYLRPFWSAALLPRCRAPSANRARWT